MSAINSTESTDPRYQYGHPAPTSPAKTSLLGQVGNLVQDIAHASLSPLFPIRSSIHDRVLHALWPISYDGIYGLYLRRTEWQEAYEGVDIVGSMTRFPPAQLTRRLWSASHFDPVMAIAVEHSVNRLKSFIIDLNFRIDGKRILPDFDGKETILDLWGTLDKMYSKMLIIKPKWVPWITSTKDIYTRIDNYDEFSLERLLNSLNYFTDVLEECCLAIDRLYSKDEVLARQYGRIVSYETLAQILPHGHPYSYQASADALFYRGISCAPESSKAIYAQSAEYCIKAKNFQRAADMYAMADLQDEMKASYHLAADSFLLDYNYERAADLYERAENYQKAAELYARCNPQKHQKALQVCERVQEPREIYRLYKMIVERHQRLTVTKELIVSPALYREILAFELSTQDSQISSCAVIQYV